MDEQLLATLAETRDKLSDITARLDRLQAAMETWEDDARAPGVMDVLAAAVAAVVRMLPWL